MSILLDAMKITRALLNDDDGLVWADHLIISKVVQAWGELIARFQLNGISVVKEESTPIVVLKTTLVLVSPSDLQYPIKLMEYGIAESADNAVPMTQQEFVPNVQQGTTLRYWTWTGQAIHLLGATVDRNVLLYYINKLDAPKKMSDTLTVDQSELWLGPRVAALIYASKGDLPQSQAINAIAEGNIQTILMSSVKRMQSMPVRRRPFSYQFRRRRMM